MYYIFIRDNKINGCGQCRILNDNVINYEVEEDFYNKFVENPDMYIWDMENQEVIKNPSYEQEQTKARKKEFYNNFLSTSLGNYRLQPKGYANAQQSIDTINNMVNALGSLTNQISEMILFYETPDLTDETQCTEEWLVTNQFKNETMTAQEFGQFYVAFMTGWNTQEHKE